jgi:RimJ/RimL family protein N-acetyltransferase
MEHPFVIHTEQPQTLLRIYSPDDAATYFDSIQRSREHLAAFMPGFRHYYNDVSQVEQTIVDPSRLTNDDDARFGIWANGEFAGTAMFYPRGMNQAEIAYWLDIEHLHQGFATVSVRALAKYCKTKFSEVRAKVTQGNEQSVRVLERCDFTEDPVGESDFRVFTKDGLHLPQR